MLSPVVEHTRDAVHACFQVAFVQLKIPVTDRQLTRVAEALMRDIQAASKTVEHRDAGLAEEETLQGDKLARWGRV
jgi:hypothetical protein